jgi:signal transduction histidine kinase/CheY-like chemotaxis protein
MSAKNQESNNSSLNLLQVKSSNKIIDEFLKSISANWKGVQFIYHPKVSSLCGDEIVDLNSSENNLGLIEIKFGDEVLSNEAKALIKNAVKVLAVLLENRKKIEGLTSNNRKLEQSLSDQDSKLEEVDLLKTTFIANVSHEIRTPLNGILGFSELLKKKDISPDKRIAYADIIFNNGQQLLNIITDVIDLSKISAGQLNLEEKQVFLKQLLEHLHFIFLNELKKSEKANINLKIIQPIENVDIIILADGTRLKQILQYLLSNAVKFTHSGEISFGFKTETNKVVFQVNDTGIGIDPKHKKLVFEHFRQSNESISREYGGTGLGLAISKKLVELMGGKIWFESELNLGSSFYFSLPLKRSVQDTIQSDTSPQKKRLTTFKNKKLLVVEDDPSSFQLIKAILEETGIQITHADNGLDAVKMCLSLKPDLVFMDIQLPKMNGYDAVRNIRINQPDLLIIAITANAFEEDRQRCLAIGCNDYYSKPVSKDLLVSLLYKYININNL